VNPLALAATTFAISAVEFVEAATIVLAVGVTAGWRGALGGAAAATLALIALVAVGSPLLVDAAGLAHIELIAGPFAVLFGAWWLRKPILRYAGRVPMRDERAVYAREVARLRGEQVQGLAVSFQGVFTEGLEVVIVVVTVAAANPSMIAWSIGGALLAFAVVTLAAVALRAPFSRIPENALKSFVGVMLLSLGTFWSGEGAGVAWWWGDATLAALIALYALLLAACVTVLRLQSAPR